MDEIAIAVLLPRLIRKTAWGQRRCCRYGRDRERPDRRQNLLTGVVEEEVLQKWPESGVTSPVMVRIIDRWLGPDGYRLKIVFGGQNRCTIATVLGVKKEIPVNLINSTSFPGDETNV